MMRTAKNKPATHESLTKRGGLTASLASVSSLPFTAESGEHPCRTALTGEVLRHFAIAAAAAALTIAFILGSALLWPAPLARADDSENVVNPQQRPDSSFIYDTSIASLAEADAYYNNQTVQVVGEAIGDSIRESTNSHHRWITLAAAEKDSTATVSVFMTNEQAAQVDSFGKYGVTGTKLQVRGTFHLVCPEHEGLSDLHAETVSMVEPGKRHGDTFDAQAFVPGAVVVVIGLLLMGAFYYVRERQR